MKYCSTRSVEEVSFEKALFFSYCQNGGLFVPKEIPQVDVNILKSWKDLTYPELVKEIVSLFVSEEEVPIDSQHELIDEAFTKFDTKNVVELARLKDGLNILELWHGDTLAFKDLSMTCTLQFMNYFLKKRKRRFTSIVITSGDTGSSAMYAARHVDNIDLIVMYPHNRISELQELMMTTIEDKNLHVYAVDGSSDEIDVDAMKVLNDNEFVHKHNVGTMNSQNWCRVMVQIAHHIYGYLQTTKEIGEPVNIIVPCGGCGNLSAMVMARYMGVPLRPTATCNKNNTVHKMVTTNQYISKEIEVSVAPAMDISYGANFERVLWLLADKDTNVIRSFYDQYFQTKHSSLPQEVYDVLVNTIQSTTVSDQTILDTVKRCWDENKYFICPHTATAVSRYYELSERKSKSDQSSVNDSPTLCIATACAAKFSEVLVKAGLPSCQSEKIERLRKLDKKFQFVSREENWEKIIREKVISIST